MKSKAYNECKTIACTLALILAALALLPYCLEAL